jgi:hypothetical protein
MSARGATRTSGSRLAAVAWVFASALGCAPGQPPQDASGVLEFSTQTYHSAAARSVEQVESSPDVLRLKVSRADAVVISNFGSSRLYVDGFGETDLMYLVRPNGDGTIAYARYRTANVSRGSGMGASLMEGLFGPKRQRVEQIDAKPEVARLETYTAGKFIVVNLPRDLPPGAYVVTDFKTYVPIEYFSQRGADISAGAGARHVQQLGTEARWFWGVEYELRPVERLQTVPTSNIPDRDFALMTSDLHLIREIRLPLCGRVSLDLAPGASASLGKAGFSVGALGQIKLTSTLFSVSSTTGITLGVGGQVAWRHVRYQSHEIAWEQGSALAIPVLADLGLQLGGARLLTGGGYDPLGRVFLGRLGVSW